MATMEENSIDAIVTDPPYHLASIVKRFGKQGAAEAKSEGATGVFKRASAGFMGKSWDGGDIAFDPETWRACARVLKPGGHLLAFGAPKNFGFMQVALVEAGFEIRDVIAWLFGTGFPKSHDVAKSIDKHNGIWRGKAGAVLERTVGQPAKDTEYERSDKGPPITPPAQEWAGWGTALKPAYEPIIMARKPLMSSPIYVRSNIEAKLHELGVSEIVWTKEDVSAAVSSSVSSNLLSTGAPKAEEISAANVVASETDSGAPKIGMASERQQGNGDEAISDVPVNYPASTINDYASKSSEPTVAGALAAENGGQSFSLSITSEAAEQLIGVSCTERSMPISGGAAIRPDTESFAGIATGLSGSMAHVRIKRNSDGTFQWPRKLPERVEGNPLTVAENVLAHGTGAINIDVSRVDGDNPSILRRETAARTGNTPGRPGEQGRTITNRISAEGYMRERPGEKMGRWPANVVTDGSAEVVELFPQTTSGLLKAGTIRNSENKVYGKGMSAAGKPATTYDTGNDSGSAARFFFNAGSDLEWLCDIASDAESCSSLDGHRAASVLRNAVARSMPQLVLTSVGFPERFMSVTPRELRRISEIVIETIQSFDDEFSPAMLPEKRSRSNSLVNVVATRELIGIITITVSLSKSNGDVAPVTFNVMLPSAEAGAKGCATRFHYSSKANAEDRIGSKHPTIKPLALMRWLVRMVTPPGGVVLDPFAGTGTTGEAAAIEGFNAILTEADPDSQEDIRRRMKLVFAGPEERRNAILVARGEVEPAHELPLFEALAA